ncbi:hypothetical protein [Vallicoccus soli]|uniref:Uncharacterized protein n=1 Tax=Vallicoccus soli TaxID=2339232 RepID=A0A3A3ZC75_9ACTN|nr:hypothetical protein [Vallicoccus soli]RJK92508.1 hypothetical protein D5H78_18700 [Vallicoccus soli]
MARVKKKATGRTMGTRAVRVLVTLPVKGGRKITDSGMEQLEEKIMAAIEEIDTDTIFARPAVVEISYARDVELREPFEY